MTRKRSSIVRNARNNRGPSCLGGCGPIRVTEDERCVAAWQSAGPDWWGDGVDVAAEEAAEAVAARKPPPEKLKSRLDYPAVANVYIGRRAKGARERMRPRLRICDLSQLAGVSAKWLSGLENGRGGSTRVAAVRRLAKALRVEAAWLLGGQRAGVET